MLSRLKRAPHLEIFEIEKAFAMSKVHLEDDNISNFCDLLDQLDNLICSKFDKRFEAMTENYEENLESLECSIRFGVKMVVKNEKSG